MAQREGTKLSRFARKLVGLLWRWHRRTGLVIFVFILLLASTGIVLNHVSELELDQHYVDSSWLIGLYGDRGPGLKAYPVGERWISRSAGGTVYLDSGEVAACRGELVGALSHRGMYVVACAEELLLVTPGGELVESITASTGLRVPLSGFGLAGERLLIQVQQDWWLADLDALDFDQRSPAGVLITQHSAGELPESLRARLPSAEQWLTWERVLLDLHSGRLLGRFGVWLMDLVAVLLICIASSGLAMWWFHRRRKRA